MSPRAPGSRPCDHLPRGPKLKTILRILPAVLIGAVVYGAPARAQLSSATTSSSVTATVVPAITLTKNVDMDFAKVVSGASGGTVVLSTAGARSATGGATLANGTGAAAASFTVGGDPSATYTITLPASVVINDGGSNNMTVNTFTSNPSGTGALSGGGSQTLSVGATLQIGASQPSGTYTGTFNVTVAYN